MKTKLIASALLAMSIAASGSAMAQRGNDHDNDNRRHNNKAEQSDHNGKHDDARKFKRDDSRGGGPKQNLRRGQKLSQEYRSNRYVVSDWKARHLSAPPRGHHWVRAGNDYVLASIATGVINQILLSN